MDFKALQDKLDNPTIYSKHLLGKVALLNESDRESGAFTDPRYLPFYYHIGKLSGAKSLCRIEHTLALEDVCFIQGAKTERWFGYEPMIINNAGVNLAQVNVGKFCEEVTRCIDLNDFEEKVVEGFDAFIVTHARHLEVFRDDIWNNLSHEGLLIVDNIYSDEDGKEIFSNFAKSVSRETNFFKTRLGIGIVER